MTSPNPQGPEAKRIQAMFGSIAGGYDRANSVLSGGVHHRWKRECVRWADVKPGDSVLDLATGTGDLALEFRKAVGVEGRVVGLDFTAEMLVVAREKAQRFASLEFVQGDAQKLDLPSASFHVTSIAFGIRNVERPLDALKEMVRVLKPDGRLMVLEFGQPPNKLWNQVYEFYSRKILPRVGSLITGNRAAYEYLEDSSRKFPCGEAFLDWMRQAGEFKSLEFHALWGGIAYLYKGVKK